MPKPIDNGSTGGGKGGGGNTSGGGDFVFAVAGLNDIGDSLTGTGDPLLDANGQPTQTVDVVVTDPVSGRTWTGSTTTWVQIGDVWHWTIALSDLDNPADAADSFSDEFGSFSVVASYEETNPKNGRTKTITTEPFDLNIQGADLEAPTASAPVLLESSDSGLPGDGVTNVELSSFRIDFDPTVQAGDWIELLVGGAVNLTSEITQTDIANGYIILTVTNSGLQEGANEISVRLYDNAGNSHTTVTTTVTLDTVAAPVTIGTADADGLVSDPTPILSGTTEAGATVELLDGTGRVLGTTVSVDGSWSIEAAQLDDGVHDLQARVTDAAGNVSLSAVLSLTVDTSVSVATIDAIRNDTGVAGDNVTSDGAVVIDGQAEAGSSVILYRVVNGQVDLSSGTAASVDASGNWSASAGTLPDGDYVFRAEVTDAAGNTAWTGDLSVTVDTTAVAAALTEVLVDGGAGQDTLVIDSGTATTDTTPLLRGTAERNARIEVYLNGVLAAETVADGSGTWEVGLTGLDAGSYDITLRTVDLAGNVAGGPADPAAFSLIVEQAPPPAIDPLYAEQWNLAALGGIEEVWQDYTGQGVKVAVYDDGVAYDHVDLDDNYDASLHLVWNGVTLDAAPTTGDEALHGTAVAGVIAAERNGEGTIGIAYDATLVGVNIFTGGANINATDSSGFEYAIAQMSDFDVVNHSWGSLPVYLNDTVQAILAYRQAAEDAAATGRGGLGTIILKAAGNWADSAQGDFADTTRFSITVGAYDSGGDVSWYSNRGANILISAPSSGLTIVDANNDLTAESDLRVATTDRDGSFGYGPESWSSAYDTSGFGGTSAATPTVAGVVALMLEANPDLGWRDVQDILAQSARWIGSEIGVQDTTTEIVPVDLDSDGVRETTAPVQIEYFAGTWNGAETWNGGGMHFSEDYGFGAVDALAAVRMAEVWSFFGPAQTSANEAQYSTGVMTPAGFSVSGNGDIATWTFDYAGPAMDLEYVDIYVNLETIVMQEVMLTITSPDGTTATLLDLPINDYTPVFEFGFPFLGVTLVQVNVTYTFGANTFRGEDPTGTWTVTLQEKDSTFDVDNYGTEYDGNSIVEFGMDFYGTTGPVIEDDVYTYTDEMLSLNLASDASRVTLSDTGGSDWLNLAAMKADIDLDLSSGVLADGGAGLVQIAAFGAGTVIEHAVTGDGNDTLVGNAEDNDLAGMRGDDLIDGGAGQDDLYGHLGNDTLVGGSGADVFHFAFGHGDDVILDFDQSEFDIVSLSGFAETSFEELSFADFGADRVLSFAGGDSLTFAGAGGLTFSADDFLFDNAMVA